MRTERDVKKEGDAGQPGESGPRRGTNTVPKSPLDACPKGSARPFDPVLDIQYTFKRIR